MPQNAWKRSVLRQLHTRRGEVEKTAGIGSEYAAVRLNEDGAVLLSSKPVLWQNPADGARTLCGVFNELAAAHGALIGILLTVFLPSETEEAKLRELVCSVEAQCGRMCVQLLEVRVETTDAVRRPLLTVTGVGQRKEAAEIPQQAVPGDDLVITKWIAMDGTAQLAVLAKERLAERLPLHLIQTAAELSDQLSVEGEAAIAASCHASAMLPAGEGGIFAALWDLAEHAGVGLEVDLKKLPIRQETVEICELLGLNPYQLASMGSLVISVSDGNELVMRLADAGIPAALVGKVTSERARVIRNGEEIRYLDLPQADEIYRLTEKREA